MEKTIREYFNLQLYPYCKRVKLDYKNKINTTKVKLEKSNKLDTENWINNGFTEELYKKLYKTSGYGNYYLLLSLLDVSVNLYEWKYNKYEEHFDHPYFIGDSEIIRLLKNALYYAIDIYPIKKVCFIISVKEFQKSKEYFSNIEIYKYNSIDIDYIPKNKRFDLLVCNPNIWLNYKWGLDEHVKHQLIFRYIITMFNVLQEEGTFILFVPNVYSNLTLELITLISSSFEEMICCKTGIHYFSNNRRLIFKNFKRNITDKQLNNLKKIAREWEKYEPSIGTQLNLKSRNGNYLYSNIKQFETDENDHFVKSIGIKIDPKIQKLFKNINRDITKITIDRLNIADKIYGHYATHSSILKEINHLNIDYTIQYCKMMSIIMINQREVMKYYTQKPLYYPINNFMKDTSSISFIDPNKFKITKEGEYSVTFPVEANMISNLIVDKFSEEMTIMDGTANVGGNVISFSRFFKHTIAIELDKNNFEALKNNVAVYGLKNVELIHGNTLDYLRSTKYDLLFLDPPWGGTNYKRHSVLDLKLGNMYIRDIIVLLKKLGKKGVVFKLPKNFRITEQFLIGDLLSIYRIKNYFCAVIRL